MIGMLWYDGSNRELSVKVITACEYYTKKYGEIATVCFVNKKVNKILVNNVLVKPDQYILPNHFWLVAEKGT